MLVDGEKGERGRWSEMMLRAKRVLAIEFAVFGNVGGSSSTVDKLLAGGELEEERDGPGRG